MADRMHPYPMFPQNLTPNSLQQSQIPQQPPQSQQPDPQMISALSNPEHSRMWQQMNQLQNQYRQQPGDLTPAQMNHQMQEFARGQVLSHGQGQPIVQQIQQSFGLNAQRMNPAGPAFHDPQANQPQSLMPSSFPNVSMNAQQQQMKAAFNMNPMMHAAMTNPGVPRQLKMLPQQDMARLQQGLGAHNTPNQPAAVDMFASSSMQSSQEQMHNSPHPAAQPVGPPGANQGMVPGNQQGGVRKRPMITPAEFQERRSYLLSMIAQTENNMGSLAQSVRNGTAVNPHVQQTMDQLRSELVSRKDMYTKFVATFGAIVTQQIANGISSTMPLNPMTHSSSQQPQPQQPTVSNAQVQPGYVVGQSNQSVASPYKYPAGNGSSSMPTQAQSTLNQQIPTQPIARPNTIPPRTGGTPHQIPPGPLPNTMSPNLGNLAAQGGQKVPDQTRQSVGIMPLEKQRFETTYAQFCRSQNTPSGLRVQIGDNRTVDLHQLHVQVMHEGGGGSVNQRDMWAVIGGRLGFIQFPGNDTEPARCGPGIAQQLHNTYEQYLQHFENAYILTVKNRPPPGSSPQPIHQMNPNPLAVGNSATPDISGNPTEMPPNPRPLLNQQFIAAALRYVVTSPQDMRTQRVPENMIAFVERHRAELMKVYQQQVQLMTKRNAEQEPQNMVNGQGSLSNAREQASIGLQPGVQRPPQPIGANTMNSIAGEARMANGSFVPENVTAALQRQPPTQDQMQHAMMTINQLKHMFQQRSLPGMATQQVPDEQRQEYSQVLEQLYKMTSELDGKLPMYFAIFKTEELLRKYVAIVLTVARQRQLLATPSPQYIISPLTLRNMQIQVQKLNEEFENRWRAMKTSAVAAAANSQQQQHASLTSIPTRLNPNPPPLVSRPAPQITGRPPSIPQQHPPSQSHPHPQHPAPTPSQAQSQLQSNHSQSHSQQQSVSQQGKKNFQPPISPNPSVPPPTTVASPAPLAVAAASSSTPATSAPTPQPTTSTPQTPKSPPSKVAAKNKAPSRGRKMSRGPATPEMAPSVAGVKRPPEEDVAALTNVAPSEAEVSNAPSPKKAKTEWEGETSAALLKKQQEIENIKTDEDAAAFFDRMRELFAMSESTDNDIHHGIVSTLGQILAGVPQEPADAAATAAALSVHGGGDAGPPPTALSPHMGPANDAFLEFIDFSSFTTLEDEDNDSKAPTPDLVPSSETNPSPESGSEGELLGSTGSPDKSKIDEPGDRSDPLRLGSLREIDGGESAYYQTSEWKWDGPMATLDQPWAIYTS